MVSFSPAQALSVALAFWVSSVAGNACNPQGYLTVATTNGPVTGHLAPNASCVIEYLGVPYAKPPVGDLRFAPPQKISARKAYEAANFGFDCPLSASPTPDFPGFTPQARRIVSFFASGEGTPQSEDCLTLNAWVKPTPRSTMAAKLVVVFFYSGRNAFSFPVNAPGVPQRNWETVVSAVGCSSAANVLACMRAADWQAIRTAAAAVRPTASSSVLRSIPPFYPTPDGTLVFEDYVSLTAAGAFARLPVLLGNTANEDGYYRIPAFRAGTVPTDAQVTAFLLESFTCPVSHQAAARAARAVPAWAYRYLADWDNTRLYPTSGAYHGVDLHMIFGASADTSGLATTADQEKLTRVMQSGWFAFADDPWRGLSRLGWPTFDRQTKSLLLLGENNSPVPRLVKPSEFDAPCSTVTLGALGTPSS
ncbi:carboxylesterase [Verticillium alfalfae VaMs.102]|uniref:Carboxylesterase n=1 Tax=Verticillium alfalfae (strain VaMs.102 / ATCC MYA-4576 / FGSC 10136) TaxID=526221 RepID=C9SDV1_VERA1|nr:carboxylesterase [Verticillium alfalfae VaMs.102]EEY17221.1 carboxylesterase [Verticillium alfalfae VaMs.102]